MRRILIVILSLYSFYAVAEDVFDIAAEYNKKKNNVVDLETERRRILAEIYQIEKENNKIEIQKNDLQESKLKLDHELKEISKRIVKIEIDLHELTPLLSQRVEFAEQINKLPWFYTFLTSQSLMDLDQIISAANRINSQQADQIVSFANLVGELKIRKSELRKTATKIVTVRHQIKKNESYIEKNQIAKNTILKSLETTIQAEKKRLSQLRGKGKKAVFESGLENLALLFGTDFFNKKGDLPHPVSGQLIQAYGLNEALLADRVQLLHKGHFYKTLPDQEVLCVAPGKIKFAGPVDGFGQVVVIDHGGRYYTTYANLSSYLVTSGTEVNERDVIGKTGQSHLQMGIGLYFEIRHFSQPQDPSQWLKKGSNQLANL